MAKIITEIDHSLLALALEMNICRFMPNLYIELSPIIIIKLCSVVCRDQFCSLHFIIMQHFIIQSHSLCTSPVTLEMVKKC